MSPSSLLQFVFTNYNSLHRLKQSGGSKNGIFIKRLMPDGAALQSSRIIPGDRVLDINGVNLDGTNLAQVNNKIDSFHYKPLAYFKPSTHWAQDVRRLTLTLTRRLPLAMPKVSVSWPNFLLSVNFLGIQRISLLIRFHL